MHLDEFRVWADLNARWFSQIEMIVRMNLTDGNLLLLHSTIALGLTTAATLPSALSTAERSIEGAQGATRVATPREKRRQECTDIAWDAHERSGGRRQGARGRVLTFNRRHPDEGLLASLAVIAARHNRRRFFCMYSTRGGGCRHSQARLTASAQLL